MFFTTALTLLFLIKLRFNRNRNFHDYVKEKYGGTAIRNIRKLEESEKKLAKARLDRDFLLTCKSNNCVPKFLKFKLYRKSLYNSEFYRNAIATLLDTEINFKSKRIKLLSSKTEQLNKCLKSTLSFLTFNRAKVQIQTNLESFCNQVQNTHGRKLNYLGISPYKFMTPNDVIFNFSDYKLTDKEKALLALGLDFKLPCFRPNFVQFFLSMEKLARSLKSLTQVNADNFEQCQLSLKNLSYSTWTSITSSSKNWFPFFKKEDLDIIKKLAKNNNIVICKPDKGKGIVILNKRDYVTKMEQILEDHSKFLEINDVPFKITNKMEDKTNRVLKKLKEKNCISEETYISLRSTGSSFGILYGLPKIHKGNAVPLRPILAAYNLPNFKVAKFLVPLLSDLTKNSYSISNSYTFGTDVIQDINPNNIMVSYDVESLFTNIPLAETINLVLNKLYPTAGTIYHGFDRDSF